MGRLLFWMVAVLCLVQGISAQSPAIKIPKGSNWIASGHFNPERISPLCSHACFKAIAKVVPELFNRTVGLYRCYFSSDSGNEWWAYNSSSRAISITDWRTDRPATTYCLDSFNITTPFVGVNEYYKYYFRVTNCTGEITQQWFLEKDGKIRSALLSQSAKALYLQASLETNPNAQTGLFLGPAQTEGVHLHFTFIPVPTNGILLSAKMAAIPSPGEGSNLVSNGGFEVTSPRNTTSTGAFTIERGEPDLCYWTVGEMNIQSENKMSGDTDSLSEKVRVVVGGNDGWYPPEGANSLLLGADHLQGDATLTQLIHHRPGENYTLSFFLAGYSGESCVKRKKTVRVNLSPSNNSLGLLANETYLFDSEGEQFLVFEFVPNGSLYDRLHKEKDVANPLPWASRVHIAFQVAVALQYLHEEAKPPLVHRDIKSSNVLLIDDSHAKLADFGLSKLGPKNNEATSTAPKGSYGYIDPEYIKTGKLSLTSDVYSFGVLLLELVTGRKSVQGTMTLADWTESRRRSEDTTVIMEIVDPNIRANVDSKDVENIIKVSNRCLEATGKLRPSIAQIVTAMKNNELIPSSSGTESAGDERDPSDGGGVLGSESLSLVYEGR